MQVKKNENLKRKSNLMYRLYLLLTCVDSSIIWEYLLNVSTSKIEYSERYD